MSATTAAVAADARMRLSVFEATLRRRQGLLVLALAAAYRDDCGENFPAAVDALCADLRAVLAEGFT